MTSFNETGIYSYGLSQVLTCGPPITTIVRVSYYRLICLAVTKLKSIPIPIIPLKNHWGHSCGFNAQPRRYRVSRRSQTVLERKSAAKTQACRIAHNQYFFGFRRGHGTAENHLRERVVGTGMTQGMVRHPLVPGAAHYLSRRV